MRGSLLSQTVFFFLEHKEVCATVKWCIEKQWDWVEK
jgi:hypothetical protein